MLMTPNTAIPRVESTLPDLVMEPQVDSRSDAGTSAVILGTETTEDSEINTWSRPSSPAHHAEPPTELMQGAHLTLEPPLEPFRITFMMVLKSTLRNMFAPIQL
jgi:hypothetical protein